MSRTVYSASHSNRWMSGLISDYYVQYHSNLNRDKMLEFLQRRHMEKTWSMSRYIIFGPGSKTTGKTTKGKKLNGKEKL